MYNFCKTTNVKQRRQSMKPRIFVSSTFYDLKYMREDISNFIKAHDFDPIMFEDGDIGYSWGKNLDESCYETMRSADMVILIIGGNYGSPATGEKEDSFAEYLSVTRKEFETAANEGIPVYVFVESAVYTEYGIYESNIKNIEEQKYNIAFKATKSINVFRFIKEIHSLGKISVTEFRKASEIKEFLSKQWSDMFKNYLLSLKEDKNSEQLYDAMDNLQSLIKQMGIMVDGLGKKIIGNEEDVTYDKLLEKQTRLRAREVAKKISNIFKFTSTLERKEATEIAYGLIKEALDEVSKKHEEIDFEDRNEVIEVVDPILRGSEDVIPKKALLEFFINWEDNVDICQNEELSHAVLKMLKNDFYNSRLFEEEDSGAAE